jgi:hypothetical protein
MRDHAGNRCLSAVTYDVAYTGCAIAVTSPTAPVTRDADGNAANGSQADVTLAVGSDCVGRSVTPTCGLNSPSGVVGADGLVTLRTNICATSPCRIQEDCTFRVSNVIGIESSASAAITFDDKVLP